MHFGRLKARAHEERGSHQPNTGQVPGHHPASATNSRLHRHWPCARPGTLSPAHVVGFQHLVVPTGSTTLLPDPTLARWKDTGATSPDGVNGEQPDAHSLYAFPFTLQQLVLFRGLCVTGSLEEASQTLDVTTNYLQTVLGRLEKELNIGLVAQKVLLLACCPALEARDQFSDSPRRGSSFSTARWPGF